MRVVIAHEYYPPDIAGGGERVVQHAAEGISRLGANVTVVTSGDPSVRSFNGIETRRVTRNKYSFNLAVRSIMKEARSADVIQAFTYHSCLPALTAARLLRKPVVMGCLALFGDAWLSMRGSAAGRVWRSWERFVMTRGYDRVFFLSDYSRELGLAMGVRSASVFVNSPGVNSGDFHPCANRSGVLFVGKFHSRKGVDCVLEAARALPHLQFRLAGWGDNTDKLRAGATENVTFLEIPEPEKLWRLFDQSAIFFLPTRAETFGMAILQAMASGCAVVSTIPLPYAGFQAEVDDREAMIQAIDRLSCDPDLCREAGERNREVAATYTWERFCSCLFSVYTELADQSRGLR